ncbi:PAS/PAC sensor signal transduction histidine kinase [Nitrosospira multiformis ATCC 25196]|uniref:histidine kinase n=2 Tax=Nitrosospira multiformis TaxID=1231 RepID=Q2Y6N1_NITMU|nr:PAS/PAC sensor signal transduction histidine kinase [Nitrosospira multiformis ATCC 25196]SEA40529.1 PAS/PAC sensor signal transduction histidine kinase [Nitrosospira multiformis]SEF69151.1 PAS/PAC sensor signal transduction histidine kinase [Nitrosospira multiformis ATCC 25196]
MISLNQNYTGSVACASENARDMTRLTTVENVRTPIAEILDQSLNEIYLLNAQTLHFEYASRGARRNLGYSMDSLQKMTLLEVEREFDETSFRALIDPLMKGGKEILVFEATHLRADGTHYPVEVHLELSTRPEQVQFLVMAFDLTARRRAEAKLRANEARFRTMVNTIPQLAWIGETDGSRSWYNQRWYDYTGTTPEEMMGWGWQKVHDPQLLPEVIKRWSEATAAEQPLDMEIPLRGADGELRVFLTRAEPLRNEDGQVVQWFGTNTDVHDQRLREEAQRETEKRLQVVMEHMSEGLIISDFNRNLLRWNPAALRMHEIENAEEVFGSLHNFARIYELSTTEGNVVPIDQWPLTRILRGEHLHDLELRIRRLDKEWLRIFSYSGTVLRYENSKGLAFLTIKDITERKQAEEALRDAKVNLEYKVNERTAQLLAKSKELENFCYSVSHDLRAPLRGIAGYSRLLLENYYERLDEEGRSFLTNVRSATKHMTDLIEDLLSYSKLERRKLSSMVIRLPAFVSKVLAQFGDNLQNVRLTVSMDDFHVRADPDGLAIALRNLVDNAVKFSIHAPEPTIEIRAWTSDSNCILCVRDNGIGFDMRFYDKIFEIFQRLQRAEEYPGTGIGLAMVQKAMERMGGRVWAESQVGAGAVFYLQLPLSGLMPFEQLQEQAL